MSLHKLTEQVWFGNWQAPIEMNGQCKTVINVGHHFSSRRGRDAYWDRLRHLHYKTFYVRLALKDQEQATEEYCNALASVVDTAVAMQAMPILTHCQMGGHRGPSSAIFAAWHLAGRREGLVDELNERALRLVPGLARCANKRSRQYYPSILRYCREHSFPTLQDQSLKGG